ncbi:M23 family metallopeptidase [Brachybacterium paraconglomeratum]|uniref:peptidoglycan DD-metalloendopeptidase family protein n=1 Tax=Brachybacterium paraconglomeratum TaxID=173362 RepID=UPI0031E659AA
MTSSRSTPPISTVLRWGLVGLLLLFLGEMPARAETSPWQWPLPPPHEVIAPFDAPEHPYGPGHRGIDIGAPAAGAAVHAVAPGTVRFSGIVAGRGVVSIAHADGLLSTYEPVAGTVAAGEQVEAGTEIGTLVDAAEHSHCPAAVCLHLGARRGEDYVDPMLLLGGRGPSVLLPWAGGAGSAGGAVGAHPASTLDAVPDSETPTQVVPAEVERASGHVGAKSFSAVVVHGHRPGPRIAALA